MTKYEVAEITQTEGLTDVELRGEVDLDERRDQLREIRDSINPVFTELPADGALGLESVVISLAIGYKGKFCS